tara:strand:+ start:78 stop:752 length:675 start_codon:yes stop_codon:yes gene_type:complete
MYGRVSTKSRPLNLSVKPEEFAQEWLTCITDNKSDLTSLLKMMEPAFLHWTKVLKEERIDDIFVVALAQMLDKNPKEAKKKISNWVEWSQDNSTIYAELQYIFIERVRKIKYKPVLAKPFAIELLVAKDFRIGLHSQIRSKNRLIDREALYHEQQKDFDIAVTFTLPDFFVIRNIFKANRWSSYLFHLITQGFSSVKRAELTKTKRRNLYTKEKEIWDSLKKRQ